MINSHYYGVERRFSVLRFCTTAIYVVAGLIVLYSFYQLIDSAPRAGKDTSEMEQAMQEVGFAAEKYIAYVRIGSAAFMCLLALVIELLLGMEHNQRELVELAKIQIDIEDKRDILNSKK